MEPIYLVTSAHAGTDDSFRKKKSSKSQDKSKEDKGKEKNAEPKAKDPVEEPEQIRSESPAGSSGRNSPAESSSRKTNAEKRFEEIQRKRVCLLFGDPACFFTEICSIVARKGR